MTTVEEKLYNMDLIIEDVKVQPQTYATILKDQVYNTTMQFKLRSKINKLCKDGKLMKTTIPGTRFGQAIIYFEPRPYKIIVESTRIGVSVYYFLEYEREGKFYIILRRYWELDGTKWIEKNEIKKLFEGSILKFM
jgi:hypothetical protein